MLNDVEYAKGLAEYEHALSEPPKSEEELMQEIEEREFWKDYYADL